MLRWGRGNLTNETEALFQRQRATECCHWRIKAERIMGVAAKAVMQVESGGAVVLGLNHHHVRCDVYVPILSRSYQITDQ